MVVFAAGVGKRPVETEFFQVVHLDFDHLGLDEDQRILHVHVADGEFELADVFGSVHDGELVGAGVVSNGRTFLERDTAFGEIGAECFGGDGGNALAVGIGFGAAQRDERTDGVAGADRIFLRDAVADAFGAHVADDAEDGGLADRDVARDHVADVGTGADRDDLVGFVDAEVEAGDLADVTDDFVQRDLVKVERDGLVRIFFGLRNDDVEAFALRVEVLAAGTQERDRGGNVGAFEFDVVDHQFVQAVVQLVAGGFVGIGAAGDHDVADVGNALHPGPVGLRLFAEEFIVHADVGDGVESAINLFQKGDGVLVVGILHQDLFHLVAGFVPGVVLVEELAGTEQQVDLALAFIVARIDGVKAGLVPEILAVDAFLRRLSHGLDGGGELVLFLLDGIIGDGDLKFGVVVGGHGIVAFLVDGGRNAEVVDDVGADQVLEELLADHDRLVGVLGIGEDEKLVERLFTFFEDLVAVEDLGFLALRGETVRKCGLGRRDFAFFQFGLRVVEELEGFHELLFVRAGNGLGKKLVEQGFVLKQVRFRLVRDFQLVAGKNGFFYCFGLSLQFGVGIGLDDRFFGFGSRFLRGFRYCRVDVRLHGLVLSGKHQGRHAERKREDGGGPENRAKKTMGSHLHCLILGCFILKY